MKKQTKDILTTKDAVLADVFFIIYFSLCILGFGVNGTEVPSGVNLISIVLSAALAVGFGTKVLNDLIVSDPDIAIILYDRYILQRHLLFRDRNCPDFLFYFVRFNGYL